MLYLWVAALFLVAFGLACLKNYIQGYGPGAPPGPFPWPVLGLFHRVIYYRNQMLEINAIMHEQYGDTFSWKVLHLKGMSIADPECLKHVLQTNFKNYIKGDYFVSIVGPFFGKGIFAVNGKEWLSQRTTAKPLFRTESLKSMVPTFIKGAHIVLQKLEEAASSSTAIDVQDLFFRYTLDSIGLIGFGHDIGSLHQPVEFSKWFDFAQAEIDRRGDNPIRKYFIYKELDETLKKMDDFVYGIIRERRRQYADDALKQQQQQRPSSDLLSRFLALTDEHGQPFPDSYLRDILINFFIAGRDTTALLLTWTFYLLSQHPQELQKVEEEVEKVVGGGLPTYEHIHNMPFLQAVQKETLRLYPPVPCNLKEAVEDDFLPNGYFVPAGTHVQFNAYTVHRSKKLWGADAEEFRPSRWLEDDFEKKIHPFQYFPFHAGPRLCLGMNMAYIEARILTCMIVQRFRLRLRPGHPVAVKKAITMPARHGMQMLVEPIAHEN
jgi:cytochrome P450